MAPPPLPDLQARMLGLAVAKAWLHPEQAVGRTLADLVAEGVLLPSQASALEAEIQSVRGELPGGRPAGEEGAFMGHPSEGRQAWEAGGTGASPSSNFRARWIREWAHYKDLTLLAEGGMGRVFKARDVRLGRMVALKLLRRDDPDLERRLVQEAELQARINHPHVCAIHESGYWSGQAYIAMELVAGDTFSVLAKDLDLRTKLTLMVQACEGVHAAHRQGLIHRDLKPANLMAVNGEDGWRAVVMDFGLARSFQPTGLTKTGMVMGTVAYMSPEQARGQDWKLDRRTDVYALGVTFYEFLTGKTPFHWAGGLDALARILHEEPSPPKGVDPDLATVVLKCLEKEPSDRYDSARALGDELQRILDGEPILARPLPWNEWLLRRARKHRTLVAVGAIGLVASLTLGGFAVRERLLASRRADYAQRFGQEAERIEALMRVGRVSPAHALGREREAARRSMEDISRQVALGGPLAQGPGAYALGRGWLALGDLGRARQNLERAWSTGFQTPEVAYALGRTFSAQYTAERAALQRIPDPEVRRAEQQALDRRLKTPALTYLRAGLGASLDPVPYQEGLVALVDGRVKDAVAKARETSVKAPWFYQAFALEAESRLVLAQQASTRADGQAELAAAQAAAKTALGMAPSDPDLAELATQAAFQRLQWAVRSELDLGEAVSELESACEAWARLEPDTSTPRVRQARAYFAMAERERLRSGAFHTWLDRAEALLASAMAAGAPTQEALVLKSELLVLRYRHHERGSQQQGVLVRQAIDALEAARALDDSRDEVNARLLLRYVELLEHLGQRGENDATAFSRARTLAAQLGARYPDSALYGGSFGTVLVERANNASNAGEDPEPWLDQAFPLLEEACRRKPLDDRWPFSLANAHFVRTEHRVRKGLSAGQALAATRAGYQETLRISPLHPSANLGLAMTEELATRLAVREGRDPAGALQAAEQALNQTARLWKDNWLVAFVRAQLDLDRARWAQREGRPTRPWVAQVQRRMAHLIRRAPHTHEVQGLQRDLAAFLGGERPQE